MPTIELTPGTTHLLGEVTFTTLDLFLFSAAGWHPHRIHFDHPYATQVESHPDLVVHGPLQAVRLFQSLDLALPPRGTITRTTYRHVSPLYVDTPATMNAEVISVDDTSAAITVYIETSDGTKTTTGVATVSLA